MLEQQKILSIIFSPYIMSNLETSEYNMGNKIVVMKFIGLIFDTDGYPKSEMRITVTQKWRKG